MYEKRISVNGTTNKDRVVNNTLDTIKRNINPVNIKDVIIDGVSTQLVLKKSDKENKKFYYNLYNATTKLGSVIEYNDSKWLITYIDSDNDVYESGTLTKCNHLFKWQDSKGNIKECWGIIKNEFLKTVSDDKRITNAIGKLQFFLPYNDDTSKIPFGKRFITEIIYNENNKPIPKVFKVGDIISADTNYGNGRIISFVVDVDEANENDNIELMIADYIETNSPTPPVTTLKTVVSGSDVIKSGGSTRTWTVNFYDENNVEDISITATWECILPEGYEDKFILTPNDNFIQIKLLSCDEIVGQTITLKVSGNDVVDNIPQHYAEFIIKVVGIFG